MADAEIKLSKVTTVTELQNMDPVCRSHKILTINVIEKLIPDKDGINLNEGYEYEINGSLPQVADGIAKMLIEMDKDKDFGERAGSVFLTLIQEYYNKSII